MKRLVLYASYPKTGSTLLSDLVERWARSENPPKAEIFYWGGTGNNFRITESEHSDVVLVKTHFTIGDFLRKLRKSPGELEWLQQLIQDSQIDIFNGRGCGFIYNLRNPFCVLVSALSFSKLLYAAEDVREAWLKDGRANKYFVDFLGLDDVPEVQDFTGFSLFDLSDDHIEDILWRYLDSAGSIPIFEPGEMLSYFRHVNYYHHILSSVKLSTKLSYEGMMARDADMFRSVSGVLGIPTEKLTSAWDAESKGRGKGHGKYKKPFYASFNTSTPERIKSLRTWPQMRRYVAQVCPPLEHVTN